MAVFPVHAVKQAMTRDTLTSAAEREQRTLFCPAKFTVDMQSGQRGGFFTWKASTSFETIITGRARLIRTRLIRSST